MALCCRHGEERKISESLQAIHEIIRLNQYYARVDGIEKALIDEEKKRLLAYHPCEACHPELQPYFFLQQKFIEREWEAKTNRLFQAITDFTKTAEQKRKERKPCQE